MYRIPKIVLILLFVTQAMRGVVVIHKGYTEFAKYQIRQNNEKQLTTWMASAESRDLGKRLGPFPH